jgi:AraC-like DNA-binding protein
MRALNREIPVIPQPAGTGETWFLENLRMIIEQKGKDPGFGVEQLAECMSLSRVQLNRKLMSLTGQSPGRRTAERLLREGYRSVKQVAWESGFQGQASFCRSFRQTFSCSPSRFRMQARKDQEPYRWKIPVTENDLPQLLKVVRQKTWLSQLLRVVISNLGNATFTVGELSDELNVSTSSLNRKMQDALGVAPQRFIRELRLQHAAELLAMQQDTVSDVAYKSGFFDHAHLCRCFKLAFGCRPSDYEGESRLELSVAWLENKLMDQTGK